MNIENTVSCIADTAIYEYKFILKYIYLLIYKLTLIINIEITVSCALLIPPYMNINLHPCDQFQFSVTTILTHENFTFSKAVTPVA